MRRLIAILVFFAAAHNLLSQEWEFPKQNFAITPPVDWHVITNIAPQPGLVVVYGNDARTRMVYVSIDDHDRPDRKMDDQVASEIEKGIERNLGKRIWGRFVNVAGLKVYERLGDAMLNGKHLSFLTRCFATDDRFYSVTGMRTDGDATEASDIVNSIGSFRFIRPPAEPGSFRWTLTSGGILIAVIITVIRRHAKKGPPPVPSAPPNAA